MIRNFVIGREYQFKFTNYENDQETRHVLFLGLDHGSNVKYPDTQWFMRTWDIERGQPRSFPLTKIDTSTITPWP